MSKLSWAITATPQVFEFQAPGVEHTIKAGVGDVYVKLGGIGSLVAGSVSELEELADEVVPAGKSYTVPKEITKVGCVCATGVTSTIVPAAGVPAGPFDQDAFVDPAKVGGFARAGAVNVLASAAGGSAAFAADAVRTQARLLTAPSDGANYLTVPVTRGAVTGDVAILPFRRDNAPGVGDLLWAVSVNAVTHKTYAYRSLPRAAWVGAVQEWECVGELLPGAASIELIGDGTLGTVARGLVLDDTHAIVAGYTATGGARTSVWALDYSTGALVTTQATRGGAALDLGATHIIANHDCMWRTPTGTLVLGDYLETHAATVVIRSTDHGTTWATVATFADPGANNVTHCHGMAYHAATGTLVMSRGDDGTTVNSCGYWTSTDDGATWNALIGPGLGESGMVADFGHATDILVGTHKFSGLRRLNVVTGVWTEIARPTDPRQYKCQMQGLGLYGGLLYVCQGDAAGAGVDIHVGVLVGRPADPANLVLHHELPTNVAHAVAGNIRSVPLGFTQDGKLHFWLQGAVTGGMCLTPPTLVDRTAWLLSGAHTNLFADGQFAAGVDTWVGRFNMTLARDATVSRRTGGASLKCSQTTSSIGIAVVSSGDYTTATVRGNSPVLTPGHRYTLRFSLLCPGVAANSPLLNVRVCRWDTTLNSGNGAWTQIAETVFSEIAPSPTWMDFEYPDILLGANDTGLRIQIDGTHTGVAAMTSWIDCAECYDATAGFPGEDSKSADALNYYVRMPDAWTHVFAIQPQAYADLVAGQTLYVRTWRKDASNYLALCWVPKGTDCTGSWVLKRVIAGASSDAVVMANQYFNRYAMTWFTLRVDGTNLKLSLAPAGPCVHGTAYDGTLAAVRSNLVQIVSGDASGANMLPHALLDDVLARVAYSDTDVATAMAGRAAPGAVALATR
jgi:hypothetical protein